ncbi:MAG: hypothetical protein AAF702_13255 [Chloroflexota bacterium]
MIQTIVTIFLQLILGMMATVGVYFSGIGNGWELVAFPIVHSLVVCLVGALIERLWGGENPPLLRLFLGALVLSAIGAALLLIPRAWGFQGVLMPLVGAIIGYQVMSFVSARSSVS